MLASAAVLTLGFGSARAATTYAAQHNRQQVAMNAQASGFQTGSSVNVPANNAYVGGWQPVPPNSPWSGD